MFVFLIIFFDIFVYVVNNLIFVSKINRNGKNGSSLKYIGMKYIRLLLCIGGIVLLAFLVSLYFFQRNRKLMHIKVECNEEIISLNLQSYTLLLAFLNATDCQLTRKEIEKCLSGGIRECFRTAKHRLVKVLQIDPSISIVQHNRDLFQLQLPEIEVL